ncbi:hypothetical protein BMF94_6524 [Rhodotorula taiwanensis]|uniref:Protein CPL1-like domain-containing protein n=1 Tax=Rhodotorula taiwanensis TaxID=741276 RepID=A0A2S5B118_9BASI|nr:hypothetical protein BMF94_6524 [Rhodotorula taiwanensis]
MRFFRNCAVLPLLFAGAMAQIISIPGLDIGLLQDGALISIGAFANLLGGGSCSAGSTLAVSTTLIGLVRICACVNVLELGPVLGIFGAVLGSNDACPPCPANAQAVCGAGKCACQCASGFYAGPDGTCLPASSCPSPNTVNPTLNVCVCVAGFVSDGAGACIAIGASGRARSRRHHQRRDFGKAGHLAGQQVYAPATAGAASASCPRGETACPLASGGFECVDTTNSLTACGGCPSPNGPGEDCLAIPGALNVQCADSKCIVGSCFKGWHFNASGNGRCE